MSSSLALEPYLLRTIIDLIPCIIFVRDLSGKLILANRTYANFFGYEPQEIEGCYQKELYDKLGWVQPLIQVWLEEDKEVASNGASCTFEEKVNHRNGDVCLYQTSKYPIRLSDGTDAVLVISQRKPTDTTE